MVNKSVKRLKHSRRAKGCGFTKPSLVVFVVCAISAAIGFGGYADSDIANALGPIRDYLFCAIEKIGTLLAPLLITLGIIVAMLSFCWKGIHRP